MEFVRDERESTNEDHVFMNTLGLWNVNRRGRGGRGGRERGGRGKEARI